MLRNILTVVLRNIRRHAGYSFINIFGLALGLALAIALLTVSFQAVRAAVASPSESLKYE